MATNHHIYMKKTLSWKTVKERNQQQLDFIPIDVLKTEKQKSSDQDIITLPTTPIINSYLNKHNM